MYKKMQNLGYYVGISFNDRKDENPLNKHK